MADISMFETIGSVVGYFLIFLAFVIVVPIVLQFVNNISRTIGETNSQGLGLLDRIVPKRTAST